MDIARDCGLSKSAVAYVLSDSAEGRVSMENRELVKKTAAKLGYRPNLAARGLSSQKSYAIGVLLPSTRDNFYGDLVAEIQHLLSMTAYTPVFAFWETVEGIPKAVDNILSRQVDAIITCEPRYIPDNIKVPVVSYRNRDKRFDYVGYCPEEVIATGLNYLLELGHKKIGYIGNSRTDLRMQAFLRFVKEKNIINRPEWNHIPEVQRRENYYSGAIALGKIWETEEHPTALLTHNASIAIGAIRKAFELGINIPGDLSIIGYNDIRHASFCVPSLTTIRLADTSSIAEIMIEKILSRLQNKSSEYAEYIVRPELIKRESCAKPRGHK